MCSFRLFALTMLSVLLVAGQTAAQWEGAGSGLVSTPEAPKAMFSIDVVDETTVWAIPINLQFQDIRDVIRTADGGMNWDVLQLPETEGNHMPLRIFALDEQQAWVSVFRYPGQAQSRIFHTSDGGASWEDQPGPFNTTNQGVENIHFFNEQDGVAFGSPNTGNPANDGIKIYRTQNGGAEWIQVPVDDLPTPLFDERYILFSGNDSYAAVGDTIWFTTTANRVFRSVDKGANWQAFFTPLSGSTTTAGLASIAFKDHLNGMVVSFLPQQGAVTTNGGATWTTISMPSAPQARNVQYIPGTDGAYLITDGFVETSPIIAYTTNDGQEWGQLAGNPPMNCIAFTSSTSGWGGTNVPNDGEAMFRWTSDWLLNLSEDNVRVRAFELYPNPVSDQLLVKFGNEAMTPGPWRIYDFSGKMVLNGNQRSNALEEIDVTSLKPGIYVLTIEGDGAVSAEKFIKL
jgi:photosystem II stability/assembly factor-like uncharacterized protein